MPDEIFIYEDSNATSPAQSLIDKAVCANFAQVQKNWFIRKKVGNTVIPAQAGIQVERNILKRLDSRLRGNDDLCLFNNVVA